VPGGAYSVAYPAIQRLVVGQNSIRRVDPILCYVCIRGGFQQPIRQAQAFPHPTHVVGMLEIPVVKGRLDAGVGRGQPDVAGTVG
jgi:hypothetical protein